MNTTTEIPKSPTPPRPRLVNHAQLAVGFLDASRESEQRAWQLLEMAGRVYDAEARDRLVAQGEQLKAMSRELANMAAAWAGGAE